MTSLFSISDADQVTQLCFDFYEKRLSKNGKPIKNEWTILSAIIVHFLDVKNVQKKYKIVSLASGSKCLPLKDLSNDGCLVHDSHAEVLARRGFIRYIYNELGKLKNDKNYKSDIFEVLDEETVKFKLKNNLKFYLFCSHTPCGDASIMLKTNDKNEKNDGEDEDEDEFIGAPPLKKLKEDIITDIHRTGAKCVPNSTIQDTKEAGVNYHTVKALRTKPGRGDPTISMSCSDKIAKWLVVGIQGALLSNFINDPIYLDGIIISKCPYNQDAMNRALIERSVEIGDLPEGYKCQKPFIVQSSLSFKESKIEKLKQLKNENVKLNACPTSICWSNVEQKPSVVLVKGTLLGSTNKKTKSTKIRPLICKYKFFESFMNIYKNKSNTELNYNKAKQLNENYNKAVKAFLNVYSDWLRTDPEIYYNFKIDENNKERKNTDQNADLH